MPTYDYRCDACGHQFEEFQSMTAQPLRKCPQCGKNKLQRLIGTGAGVLFRGSGFYETDYRSESYKKAAEAEKPAPASDKKDDKAATPSGSAGEASKPAPSAAPAKTEPKKPSKKKSA